MNFVALLTLIGACLGSFAACVSYRLPRGISLTHPPSSCPACGHRLRWYENIPIVSYLLQHGRARCCGAPLSNAYLLWELAGALAGACIAFYIRL